MASRYPGDNVLNKGKKWNVKQLQAIPASWSGDMVSDGGGLNGEIKVNKDGKVSISFRYTYRYEGRIKKFYCGTFPKITLESIRTNRDQARNSVRQKIDPKTFQEALEIQHKEKLRKVIENEKELKISNLTVSNLYDEWIKYGVHRKNNNEVLKSMFKNNLLPLIGQIELKNLTEAALITALLTIASKKQTTAFEQDKDFRQMLRWGEKRQPFRKLLIDNNVAELIVINNFLPSDFDKVRERTLSSCEIIKCRERIKALQNKYENKWNAQTYQILELVFWICLSTLCRIGELSKAKWEHVDFENKIWFIPAENVKGITGKTTNHRIFLSDFSVAKFKLLKLITGTGIWLFPGKMGNSHITENHFSKFIGDRQIAFKSRTRKLKNRIENDDLKIGDKWTLHDLRRTGATKIQSFFSASDGILIGELCLHHKILHGAASNYLHHKYEDDMKYAWKTLGSYISELDK
jgi:integrase